MSWSDPCGNCGDHRADCSCGDWNGYKRNKMEKEGWQHFLKGGVITSEFNEDVVYSLRTEKLTKDEIALRYNIKL